MGNAQLRVREDSGVLAITNLLARFAIGARTITKLRADADHGNQRSSYGSGSACLRMLRHYCVGLRFTP
jgi:hypothetical protein